MACVFSPDGKWIAGTCDNGLVMLFDAQTGNAVQTLTDNTTRVRTATFSPSSSLKCVFGVFIGVLMEVRRCW